jgi:hypothetical protein
MAKPAFLRCPVSTERTPSADLPESIEAHVSGSGATESQPIRLAEMQP